MPLHLAVPSLLSSPSLFALLQIREGLITYGYHDSNVSNTKAVPHILPLWFELLQTGCIQTTLGQHYIQHALLPNGGSEEPGPTEIQHAAASLHNFFCSHARYINLLALSHLLPALLDVIPWESNFAIIQNSGSKLGTLYIASG